MDASIRRCSRPKVHRLDAVSSSVAPETASGPIQTPVVERKGGANRLCQHVRIETERSPVGLSSPSKELKLAGRHSSRAPEKIMSAYVAWRLSMQATCMRSVVLRIHSAPSPQPHPRSKPVIGPQRTRLCRRTYRFGVARSDRNEFLDFLSCGSRFLSRHRSKDWQICDSRSFEERPGVPSWRRRSGRRESS